ncbi:trypsin-like peptidase domain-containing protein [Patescibacteria group bacterium]|nr:trypsin-like peptidase domain-containing protein [Patescibacteria group bacterium]
MPNKSGRFFLILLSLFCVSLPLQSATAQIRINEVQAVGQIRVYDRYGYLHSSGSATVIDDDGHVLTNHHVIQPFLQNSGYSFTLCLTVDPEEPPFCSFEVNIVDHDESIDLALLKIVKVDSTIGFEEFKTQYKTFIPSVFMDLGLEDYGVKLGDEIHILGYPGTGGSSITFTKGSVSGFESYSWEGEYVPWKIKTDADIDAGNSGGAAFDAYNNFIGIPTEVATNYDSLGYLISVPIISAFLDESGVTLASSSGSCYDLTNGGFDPSDDGCWCYVGFEFDDTIKQCIPAAASTPSSTTATPAESAAPVETPAPAPVSLNSISQCRDIDSSDRVKCSLTETNDAWINTQLSLVQKTDAALIGRLGGRILLQVEDHGEAWYIDPITKHRFYMKDGPTAYEMMRSFGLGISNVDLEKIKNGDKVLIAKLKGRIVLQVEAHGEAYYIHPVTGVAHYLKNGEEAYKVMRLQSLGITNTDLKKIPIRPFIPLGFETK